MSLINHLLCIFLSLGLFTGLSIANCQYGWNEQSDILPVEFVNNTVKLKDSIPNLSNTKGFPILDCTFRDGNCEFPKNRFLAKFSNGKYMVLDSNLMVIIGASDSIISFSHNVQSESSAFDVACTPSYRGVKRIYYQSIRDGYTTLFDFSGKAITSHPFLGELFEGSYNIEANSSFWVTVNCHCDSLQMGLIDSNGNEIAKQMPVTKRFISQFDYYYDHLWNYRNPITNEIQLINAETGELVLVYEGLDSFHYEHGVFVYKKDGKYGLFHPSYGVLKKPKYDKISSKDQTNDTYLLKKGKREVEWVVGEDMKKSYVQMQLNTFNGLP